MHKAMQLVVADQDGDPTPIEDEAARDALWATARTVEEADEDLATLDALTRLRDADWPDA